MAQSKAKLIGRGLWELLRYDAVLQALGFERAHRGIGRLRSAEGGDRESEVRIVEAMRWAISLYWKPALCLQRSVATARVLRSFGLDAHVVIGYRSEPFLGHAWVEMDGRIINDEAGYQRRLTVLERI